MQICTLPQTHNHASTPPLSFLQAGFPFCFPNNSVKALKFVKNVHVRVCRVIELSVLILLFRSQRCSINRYHWYEFSSEKNHLRHFSFSTTAICGVVIDSYSLSFQKEHNICSRNEVCRSLCLYFCACVGGHPIDESSKSLLLRITSRDYCLAKKVTSHCGPYRGRLWLTCHKLVFIFIFAFSALTLLVGQQEGIRSVKN